MNKINNSCADSITSSFSCLTANSLIYTLEGYKKIKEVKDGNLVLTHNNQYKKVLTSKCIGRKELYEVKAVCTDKLECTENHKFLVTKLVNGKILTPSWVETKSLTNEHYLMMPINTKENIPKLQILLSDGNLWYRVGKIIYLLASKLKNMNNTYENELMNELIPMFIDDKKHVFIPNFVLDLPVHLLQRFLDGFIETRKSRTTIDSFIYAGKRNLIYMLGQCIAKAYRKPFAIKENFIRNECKIEFDTSMPFNDIIYTPKYLLYRVISLKRLVLEDKVYDIEVEEDHSFAVNNCIAHSH